MSSLSHGAGGGGHGRFRKGQSGNPAGRPARPAVATANAFDIVIDRTLQVTLNGAPREVTMEEALQQRTYQDAIAGKRMAQREVLKWIEKRQAWFATKYPEPWVSPIRTERWHDASNADEAMQLLGIALPDERWGSSDPNDVRLLLEPWAVQAALDRRRGATALDEKQIEEITRCTRDAAMLCWPGRRRR